MNPYVRLAAKEFLPYALLFAGLVLVTLGFFDFRETLVLPERSMTSGLMAQWLMYAIALGFAVGCWEESRDTLDYSTHRGLSFDRQVRLCHAPALASLAFIVVVPLALWSAFHALVHPDAGAAQWGRLGDLFLCGTITASAYAAGFWSGALRGAWLVRIAAAVTVGFCLMMISRKLMAPTTEGWAASRPLFVLAQAVATATFLFAGHRALALERDVDRPAPAGRTLLNGALFAVALSLSVSDHVRDHQRTRLMSLHAEYPSIVRFLDGAEDGGADAGIGSTACLPLATSRAGASISALDIRASDFLSASGRNSSTAIESGATPPSATCSTLGAKVSSLVAGKFAVNHNSGNTHRATSQIQ